MDKIAHYEELIMEKIATRAWKKHYDGLNDIDRQKLVNSGIHNYERELSGLKKGTQNILNKYNVEVVRNPIQFYMETRKVDRVRKGAGKLLRRESAGGASINHIDYPELENKILFKHRDHTRDIDRQSKRDFKIKPFKQNRLNSFERDYANAIIERHEADEKRYRVSGKKQAYFTHVSPKVIFNESENVSFAPHKTRNALKDMRRISGEMQDIRDNGVLYSRNGYEYGDGKFDKNLASVIKKKLS